MRVETMFKGKLPQGKVPQGKVPQGMSGEAKRHMMAGVHEEMHATAPAKGKGQATPAKGKAKGR